MPTECTPKRFEVEAVVHRGARVCAEARSARGHPTVRQVTRWFKVETPVGTCNPDWAIVKHHDETIYLVRETKGTKDFLKLRTTEADKVRCGQRHFEALGVPFAVVAPPRLEALKLKKQGRRRAQQRDRVRKAPRK
jgi:hypothetical protein